MVATNFLDFLIHQNNLDAWLVGGAVRDMLHGKDLAQIKDLDFVAAIEPDQLVNLLEQYTNKTVKIQTVGLKYGVASVRFQGYHIALAVRRQDITSIDQRYSTIETTDNWLEDANRRDFTINAIYWNGEKFYDPLNGLPDVQNGFVRFIGDPHKRIGQDILRFLRFFRFLSYMGDGQDVDLSAHVPDLIKLSRERIEQEIRLLKLGYHVAKALKRLEQTGAFDILKAKGVFVLT